MRESILQSSLARSQREPLPPQLVEWLESDQGYTAISNAIEKSALVIKSLDEVRKVKLDQLNTPITL